MKLYVLEGPANCGNVFGFYKEGLIPEGKFAVVENDEYANGGRGPSLMTSKVFPTREAAEEFIKSCEEEDK